MPGARRWVYGDGDFFIGMLWACFFKGPSSLVLTRQMCPSELRPVYWCSPIQLRACSSLALTWPCTHTALQHSRPTAVPLRVLVWKCSGECSAPRSALRGSRSSSLRSFVQLGRELRHGACCGWTRVISQRHPMTLLHHWRMPSHAAHFFANHVWVPFKTKNRQERNKHLTPKEKQERISARRQNQAPCFRFAVSVFQLSCF